MKVISSLNECSVGFVMDMFDIMLDKHFESPYYVEDGKLCFDDEDKNDAEIKVS